MRGRRGPFVAVVTVVALAAGAIALLSARAERKAPPGRTLAAGEPSAGDPPPPAGGRSASASPPARPATSAAAPGADAAPTARPEPPAATAPPDAPIDEPAWRSARLASGVRELGAMGPYVRIGLDAARRDMAFCFKQAGAAPRAETDARPEPAVLLLYLEAREGAIDVVDARTEYLGSAAPEVVACCRQVLRGSEIPAFNAVPGARYRLKYLLE